MTEEEKKAQEAAAKKKEADDLAGFWLGNSSSPASEPEPESKPTNIEDVTLDVNQHSGGVPETLRRMKLMEERAAQKPTEPTDDEKAAAEKAKADAAKAEAEKRKVKFNLRPTKAPEPASAPEPKPASTTPPITKAPEPKTGTLSEQDQAFVASLPEDLQDSVAFWQDAESVDPEKYKGKLAQQLDYLKRFQAEVDQLKQDDEDFDPESSPELRRWVQSQTDRPRIGLREQQADIEKKLDSKLNKTRAAQEWAAFQARRVAAERPKAEQAISKFSDELAAEIPAEILETYTAASTDGTVESALSAISDEHGASVAEAIRGTVVKSASIAEAYVNLTRGIEPLDDKNPLHHETIKTVIELGKVMMEDPALAKLRTDAEGRTFLPREKYYSTDLTPEQRAKHFTFTEEQVLGMIADRAKKSLKVSLDTAIAKEKEIAERRAKRYGYDVAKKDAADATRNDDDPPPSRITPGAEGAKGPNDAIADFFVRGTGSTGD